jgi:hypothetical protein
MKVAGYAAVLAVPKDHPVFKAFGALSKACGQNAIMFNDQPTTTARMVAAKMREAADRIDAWQAKQAAG